MEVLFIFSEKNYIRLVCRHLAGNNSEGSGYARSAGVWHHGVKLVSTGTVSYFWLGSW